MNKKNNKIKVLVCLSGGVDSSVAVALLVKAGYDVAAAFMVNYDDQTSDRSCWRGDYHDALRVSAKLGIKLLRLDFIEEYNRDVLAYMYREYELGRTPNPDVLCNKFVKFGAWLDKARELGFDYIATGHYAQIKKSGRVFLLQEAKDKNKDQTYFLHQLNQNQLKNVLFPIGKYNKVQVRKLAQKFDLPTAEKEESMGICFVGEVPMRDFLKNKIKVQPGKIIDSKGNILGKHDGLAYYTIGQRGMALGNVGGKPLFVIEKNSKTNELVVGFEDDSKLYKKEIEVGQTNWVGGQEPKLPLKCLVRLRHRQELQSAVICHSHENGGLLIKFSKSQRAVTPGQFAVFYKKGICLGGGVIV
ncbi:MAG: tRNA 2-thiouridine(34) synthase MnmA [Candidatus Magasanikbacteria bacterium]|jgi:tRNA-specific 2-thiouridylase